MKAYICNPLIHYRRNFLTLDIYFAQLGFELESQRAIISIPDVLSEYTLI